MTAPDVPFRRVAIVGLGLIGGSWGLALRKYGFSGVRVGCDRLEVLREAVARGAVDEGDQDVRRAVAGADLVILATPVGTAIDLLAELKSDTAPEALVTDTGSTKQAICQQARQALGSEPFFLGGHPLAGKERSGIENADASLFEGAWYVLTPLEDSDTEDGRAKAFAALVASVGARVLFMDAGLHDRAAAFLSHLPQLISTGLAALIEEQPALPLEFAATGFRDVTRLAESPYAVWRDICATNTANIGEAIDAFIAELQRVKSALSNPDLEREFDRARRLRGKL